MLTKMRINVTTRCNQDCPFCFHSKSRSSKDMDFPKLEKVIAYLGRHECRRIEFLGGEPLLYPHFKEAFCLSQTAISKIVIFTNGTVSFPLDLTPRSDDQVIINFHFSGSDFFKENLLKISSIFSKFGFNMTLSSKNNISDIKKKVSSVISLLDSRNIPRQSYGFRICFDSMLNTLALRANLTDDFLELASFLEKERVLTKYWEYAFPPCFMTNRLRMFFKKKAGAPLKSFCAVKNAGSLDTDFRLGFCEIFSERHGNIFDDNGNVIGIRHLHKLLAETYLLKLKLKRERLCGNCHHWLKDCDGLCWPNAKH